MRRRRIVVFTVVTLVAFFSGAWLLRQGASPAAEVYQRAQIFSRVIQRVADLYVDSLDEGQLYDLAIDGMLSNIGDPYTGFLRTDDLDELVAKTRGDYVGLGVRIEVTDGWLTVVTPLSGTPAEEAGIEPGDRIVEVEGVSTFGWSSEKASTSLRGEAGTAVTLTVFRSGLPRPLVFDIERELIHVASVRHAAMVAPSVGYVHLETVGAQSADELHEAISTLRDAGARALILDVRFNPGGLLDQGVAVSDLFLDRGEAVLTTRGRAGMMSRTYEANMQQEWGDMPLVVLVNEFSASAAEIVAGALQDHDRGLVLGRPSFGKGVVQTIFQIGPTEALRLTTSRWFTPSGRSIHRERGDGTPVLPIAGLAPESLAVASEFQSDAGRELTGGGGIHPDIVIAADTVTMAERRFQAQLGSNLQIFLDVVSSYALELREALQSSDPDSFEVTASMRDDLLRRIRARDVTMPNAIWNGATDAVDEELRRRTLRYVFGRDAEMQDQVANDAMVSRAVEMLTRVVSQEELFELAEREILDARF